MPTPEETVSAIISAPDWNARVAKIRQIPQQHGTNQHSAIYAAVAAQLYVPNLAPDFAYVHAPDFVVYDQNDGLRAMLECKGANDGGTARDKALRFAKLREESVRLNGTPLFVVLGGLGWTRVNDTLGPVVRGLRRPSLYAFQS